MSKKDKKKTLHGDASFAEKGGEPAVSRRGWKIIGIGVLTVVIGYIVLAFTDPRGENLASRVSPLLLILGYTLIGVGIVTRDPSPPSSTPN
jgi:hypothetical protein